MDMLVNIVGAAIICGVVLVCLKFKPHWFEGKRLMSYKRIPEYVKENVESMSTAGEMERIPDSASRRRIHAGEVPSFMFST